MQSTFYQLLAVYTLLIILISLGFFWKYSLQFHVFAVIIAIFGISIISREKSDNTEKKEKERKPINKKFHYILFIVAVLFVILFRAIPYLSNSIPLGYDAGIYKYGIEHGLSSLDNWISRGGMEPGFLYLMKIFSFLFSSQFILTWLLIAFCVVLGAGIYFVTKEYSNNKTTAILALFIYAFSIVQFKTFWYMYYKNIIGLSLMLFSLYFLRKAEQNRKFIIPYLILAGLIGAIHRPSFYIFGLSFLFYTFISPYKNKKYDFRQLGNNVIYGLFIIIIASLFYLGKFSQAITIMFEPVLQGFIQPGESPGTFINFFTYQFSSLFYLPLALLGLFYLIKKRNFNILVIWAVINLAIVYFQFFFFNRFIIHLDLALIILSSFGFSLIIKQKKKLGAIILIVLLLSGAVIAFKESLASKPLVSQDELETIKQLQNTEENAFVMSTSSYYSPWILGYSERKTIAPGLFDYTKHNESEWTQFWTSQNLSEVTDFMNVYAKPLYIFIGQRHKDNLAQFNGSGCFEVFSEKDKNIIYKYAC